MTDSPASHILLEGFKAELQKGNAPGAIVVKRSVLDVAAVGQDARTARFTISNGTVDRDGDTVAPTGWVLDDYLKNPVVLWDHNPHQPPIAKAISTYLDNNTALKSVALFFDKDVSELSNTIYTMVNAGLLNACSVGFKPLEYKPSKRSDGNMPLDFAKQLLLEWSIVSVPSNPEALYEGKSLNLAPYTKWAEETLDTGGSLVVSKSALEQAYKISKGTHAVTVVLPAPSQIAAVAAPEKEDTMQTKAGRAMSKENMKHLDDAMAAHEKSFAAHKDAMECHKAAFESLKALKDKVSPKDPDGDGDDDSAETEEGKSAPADVVKAEAPAQTVEEKTATTEEISAALKTVFQPAPITKTKLNIDQLKVLVGQVVDELTHAQIRRQQGKD